MSSLLLKRVNKQISVSNCLSQMGYTSSLRMISALTVKISLIMLSTQATSWGGWSESREEIELFRGTPGRPRENIAKCARAHLASGRMDVQVGENAVRQTSSAVYMLNVVRLWTRVRLVMPRICHLNNRTWQDTSSFEYPHSTFSILRLLQSRISTP